MRFVIQVVSSGAVEEEGQTIGRIGIGFVVLIGIRDTDTERTADLMLKKMTGLRIFPDNEGKTNLSLKDVGGALLLVSQFTLYADCRKGNRPGFTGAGHADHARKIYDYILKKAEQTGSRTEHGIFGAHMKVSLVNEGPFTIFLDSDELGYS